MAKAQFIAKARKPIYENGKTVQYVSKRGKNAGVTLTKVDYTQPADENDRVIINIGDSYWKWCLYGGTPKYSKTKPRMSQLTSNWFKQQLYGLQEKLDEWNPSEPDDVETFITDMREDIEALRDECQERLDSMPWQLQDSDSGQIIQERIDTLDNIINELDGVDVQFISELNREDDETEADFLERLSQEQSEWLTDKVEELQSNIDLSFE